MSKNRIRLNESMSMSFYDIAESIVHAWQTGGDLIRDLEAHVHLEDYEYNNKIDRKQLAMEIINYCQLNLSPDECAEIEGTLDDYLHGHRMMENKMKMTETELRSHIRKELLREFSIMGTMGKILAPIVEEIKEKIARFIISIFGVDTEGFMGETIVNACGNITLGDLKDMAFGDKQIETFARELLEGMQETMLENLPEMFGVDPDGFFAEAIEEAIVNSFSKDNNLSKEISKLIAKEIDGISFF